MSILDVSITREEWLKGILNKSGSRNSHSTAKTGIKKWDAFLESLHQSDSEVLQLIRENNQDPKAYQFLNKFVQYMIEQRIAPSSNKIFFAVLKSWISANGIMLHQEYIKKFIQFPKKKREIRQPLTPHIIRTLIEKAPKMMGVTLYILLSSGMRISECLQLQVGDIDASKNPVEIRIRAETTKTLEERMAFISAEAYEKLKPYLEDKEKTDDILYKYSDRALGNFELSFNYLRKKCGFTEKYSNGVNYHVNIHAFRAYFHTQATKILDGDTAHALIGHRAYLDQYFRLTPQEKADMYHKLEPYITVSDESRLRTIVSDKDKEIAELKMMRDELAKQKAKIKRLEKIR